MVFPEYVKQAMIRAEYEEMEDGTYVGQIAACPGVITFANSLRECEDELRTTLEDWILLGLRLGHPLPVIGGVALDEVSVVEPLDTV